MGQSSLVTAERWERLVLVSAEGREVKGQTGLLNRCGSSHSSIPMLKQAGTFFIRTLFRRESDIAFVSIEIFVPIILFALSWKVCYT